MRTFQVFLMLLLLPASAGAVPADDSTIRPAPAALPTRPEDLTCDDWLAQPTAPDGYADRPDLWAACQHERLVLALGHEPPARLAAFLQLENDLQQMCDALVELGDMRTGGGSWVLHEQPRTRGEISRDLYAVSRLFAAGRAADTADPVSSELDSLRRRVVDRVRLPRPDDLRALTEMHGDSTQVAEDWRRYAMPYLSAANGVTSPHQSLLWGNDRAALDVMRLADRMLRHYLGGD